MTSFAVVIPAYNEENGIKEIIERVLAVEEDLTRVGIDQYKLLVVNDGSSDRTAEITEELAQDNDRLLLINHPRNRGYGAALKTGFAQAGTDLIGFLDADGTYPPEHFPQLCVAAMDGMDLVIGSRMAGADTQMPITRRIGNFFFANLLTILARQRVSDSASGMRVFKKEILDRIYPLPDGLNLTPVMSTRVIHEGIRMTEIPIPYSERVGRSKLSVVHDGTLFLKSMVWTALSYNPVRILGLIGLAGIAVALIAALALVVARLQGVDTLSPWNVMGLYIGAIAGFVGLSLFSLGVMFNYLVSLFHEKPIRQGLFGKPMFKQPLDRQFGWLGSTSFVIGLLVGITCLVLGVTGWDMNRLWLYGLGSVMLILTGVQLVIYWIVLRVLDELSQRKQEIAQDLS